MKPDQFINHFRTEALPEIEQVAPQLQPLWRGLEQGGYLNDWRKQYPPHESLKALKAAARRIGITKAGWRYLCRLNKRQVRVLVGSNEQNFACQSNRAWAINLLARTGEEPPSSPVVFARLFWLIFNAELWDEGVATSLRVFTRAALREVRNRVGQELAFARELSFVCDWFRYEYLEREDRARLDANQQAAEWSWFYRNAEEWHRQAFRAPPGKSGVRWESLLGPFRLYGYDVAPLLSVEDLYDEANAMEHCVITYEKYCVVGKSRIFSIRDRGRPLATFEISLRYGRWCLIQVRGWRNSTPSPILILIARETLARYRAAWLRHNQTQGHPDASSRVVGGVSG